jgi:hypothetical protein
MDNTLDKPRCCGECARYLRDKDNPGRGFCSEWPCHLHDTDVCHPNIGRKAEGNQ